MASIEKVRKLIDSSSIFNEIDEHVALVIMTLESENLYSLVGYISEETRSSMKEEAIIDMKRSTEDLFYQMFSDEQLQNIMIGIGRMNSKEREDFKNKIIKVHIDRALKTFEMIEKMKS